MMRALGALAAAMTFAATAIAADPPPNFVVIFVDNLGMNDTSLYGSEIPTPSVQALARSGITFDSWYSASPVCTPSPTALGGSGSRGSVRVLPHQRSRRPRPRW